MTYDELNANLKESNVKLVAVSKTKPVSEIKKLYERGHRDFGENRVQELTDKKDVLPDDIRWHLIGHLQKNKAKYISEFIHLIHSLDSLKLARRLNKEAKKAGRSISVLLQIKIAKEDSKYGYDFENLIQEIDALKSLENIQYKGVMGMGTFTSNEELTHSEFETLRTYFKELKEKYFKGDDAFCEISMGMSGDYKIALQHGTTMVRIGSLIFGERN